MHPVPPPYRLVPRIPVDQPFVLHQSVGKRALLLGAVSVVPFGALGALLAAAIGAAGGGAAGAVAAVGCLLLAGVLLAGLQLAVQVRSGPLFAAGPAGCWVRTRPLRSQGIWLPWEALAAVYRRRWAFERFLCLRPHDPRVGQHLTGLGAVDSAMSRGVFGTGLLVSLTLADRPADEVLAAVAHFAGGRVPLS